MINQFMKKNGLKSFYKDLVRMDFSKLDSNIIEEKDISYMNDDLQEHKLDIYYKKDNNKKSILIDLHGGGFIASDKEVDRLFCNYMAQNDYVVFSVNYRLAYPIHTVFDQIRDVSNSLKWILNNIKKYNGNKEEMYIAGHSAAGVLAIAESMLCVDEKMRNDYKLDYRDYNYRGIILDCGAMHFYESNIAYWGMRNMVFPKGYKNMKEYQYLLFEQNNALSELPKVVLITNEKDELKSMTYYFKELLNNAKVENLLIDRGSDGHMGIIFKPYTEENLTTIDEIINYFRKL